jgi:hypothetical protein
MNIQTAKNLTNAISKVILKNNLLCIYRHETKPTTVPHLLIPLQNVQTINIFPGVSDDGRFVTVFFFKDGKKEVVNWKYNDSGYGNAAVISWKEEVEKQIEDMVDLIATGTAVAATATQKIDRPQIPPMV